MYETKKFIVDVLVTYLMLLNENLMKNYNI